MRAVSLRLPHLLKGRKTVSTYRPFPWRSFLPRRLFITSCYPISLPFALLPIIKEHFPALIKMVLRATQQATPQYPPYSWEDRSPSSRIVYIRDTLTAELELSEPLTGPLGFDLEWKPTFVKGQPENPVAVVQLASADRILLFQVTAMTSASFQLISSYTYQAPSIQLSPRNCVKYFKTRPSSKQACRFRVR